MANNILKSLIYFAGSVCLIIFFAIRTSNGHKPFIHNELVNKGELYRMSFIKYFNEDLPPLRVQPSEFGDFRPYRDSDKHPEIEEADILVFGDSFSYYPRQITFPENLALNTGKKVYFHKDFVPFFDLNFKHYEKGDSKTLILEMGERVILEVFSNRFDSTVFTKPKENKIFKVLSPGAAEKGYERLLQNSKMTWKMYEALSTFKFDHLNYISELTPVYSMNPPMLFYYQTVNDSWNSYKYKFSNAEISRTVENILILKNDLKRIFNLDLIFMPVPSKITIYENLANLKEYNQFLPTLYTSLEEKGIDYINLYDPFIQSDQILYYGSDTHWNEKGVNLATDQALNFIKKQTDGILAEKTKTN